MLLADKNRIYSCKVPVLVTPETRGLRADVPHLCTLISFVRSNQGECKHAETIVLGAGGLSSWTRTSIPCCRQHC